jgi:membrane protein DedA with SNARE-associated domain
MTMLAGIAALAMAMCIGYYFGRRVGSKRTPWKKRTSRLTLGRLAITLVVSLTARRIRRHVEHLLELRPIASVELLRGSVARMRS